jgi:hypothetical protein
MKILMRTILKNIIDSSIEGWQRKLPDKPLDSYDNWRDEILTGIEAQLKKQNISLDELVIDNTENIDKSDKSTDNK